MIFTGRGLAGRGTASPGKKSDIDVDAEVAAIIIKIRREK